MLKNILPPVNPLDISLEPATSQVQREHFQYYGIDFEDKLPGVSHYLGTLCSEPYQLATHYYSVTDAVGSCFLLHGYLDHTGLYKHLIEYCLRRKLSVIIFDLPGHGLSTGEPASIDSFDQYQQAFSVVMDYFIPLAPGPYHLIGQSTGGAIVMDYLLNHSSPVFKEIALIAPLLRPYHWPLYSKLYRPLSYLFDSLPRKFKKNSSDVEFQHFLQYGDSLQSPRLSLNWIGALKQWEKQFHRWSSCDYAPLIIQGKQDETVDWRYNIPHISKKFPQAKVCYLDEAGHHLVNEAKEIRQAMFAAMDTLFGEDAGE